MSEDLFSANCNLRVSDRVDSWHMPLELCWNNVAHDIEKPAATKSRDERVCCIIRWVYANSCRWIMFIRFQALRAGSDFGTQCRYGQINWYYCTYLYGAAACMIKTAGHKKKRLNDWFDQECAQMKKSVKRQLRKFRRTNNHGEREKYVKYRKEYKLLWMKKKIKFDQERLAQLKQNFNNPSKF